MSKTKKPQLTPKEKLTLHYQKLKPPKHAKPKPIKLSPSDRRIVRDENRRGKIACFKRRRLAINELKEKIRPSIVVLENPTMLEIRLVEKDTGVVLRTSDSPYVLRMYLDHNGLLQG